MSEDAKVCGNCGHSEGMHVRGKFSDLNETAWVEGACWHGLTGSLQEGWSWKPEDICLCKEFTEDEQRVFSSKGE